MRTEQKPSLESALANVPARLRDRLVDAYLGLKRAYVESEFDACGLRAGRFCEAMLRVLQHRLTGTYIPFGTKIPNFRAECDKLEMLPQTAGPEGLRVIAPRAISFVYTLRNKRGIGHVGGDVDANEIDAACCVRVADWSLAELLRVVHSLSLEEAQALVDSLAQREMPLVWATAGKKRILDHTLDFPTQTLLLLYSDPSTAVLAEDLFSWTEYSSLRDFRRNVLRRLHQQRLIEHDEELDAATISPTGVQKVERDILPKLNGGGPS